DRPHYPDDRPPSLPDADSCPERITSREVTPGEGLAHHRHVERARDVSRTEASPLLHRDAERPEITGGHHLHHGRRRAPVGWRGLSFQLEVAGAVASAEWQGARQTDLLYSGNPGQRGQRVLKSPAKRGVVQSERLGDSHPEGEDVPRVEPIRC